MDVRNVLEGLARSESPEHHEIEAKGFNLNVSGYMATSDETAVDVATALELLRESQDELHAAEQVMWERLQGAGYV